MYMNITHWDYIVVVGCQEDEVDLPFLGGGGSGSGSDDSGFKIHKENVGILIVAADMASIMIMAFVFIKVKTINDEYLTIVDDMRV